MAASAQKILPFLPESQKWKMNMKQLSWRGSGWFYNRMIVRGGVVDELFWGLEEFQTSFLKHLETGWKCPAAKAWGKNLPIGVMESVQSLPLLRHGMVGTRKNGSFLIEFAFVIQESSSTTTKSLSGFRSLFAERKWYNYNNAAIYYFTIYLYRKHEIGWMVHDGFIRSMMFLPSTNHLTHQLSSCAMSQCGWGLHGIISHGHVSLASQVHLASCWTGAKSWKSKLISDAKNHVSESKGTSKSHVKHPTQKKRDLPRKDQKKAVGIVTLPEEVAPWMAADRRPSEAATMLQITGETTYSEINLKPQTYHVFFVGRFGFKTPGT